MSTLFTLCINTFTLWVITVILRVNAYPLHVSSSYPLHKYQHTDLNTYCTIPPPPPHLSLTARVVVAPQMISQPVSSIFPCSSLPSGTWRTQGLSIPWCCLPTSSSVCHVFFLLSLCSARWFWPDLINRRHDHTTAVCVSLLSSHFHGYLSVRDDLTAGGVETKILA